jgi:hypothetical protein
LATSFLRAEQIDLERSPDSAGPVSGGLQVVSHATGCDVARSRVAMPLRGEVVKAQLRWHRALDSSCLQFFRLSSGQSARRHRNAIC